MTLKQKPTFKTTLDLSKIIKKHNIFSSKLREKTEFFCRMGGLRTIRTGPQHLVLTPSLIIQLVNAWKTLSRNWVQDETR